MATRLMFRSFKHKKRKVTINLCENCSHFTLKYFQLNVLLRGELQIYRCKKKKQKQNKNKNKIKQKKPEKNNNINNNKTKPKKKKKKKKKRRRRRKKKPSIVRPFESALYMKSLSMSL